MASFSYLFKYVIIGDSGVGKSCFMLQFIDKRFKNNHDLTIGVEFGSRTIKVNDKSLKLQMWDTAGQESYRSITRSYYRGAIGALLIYDITKRESFVNLERWLIEVQNHANSDMAIMLVGNKSDLEAERAVSIEEAQEFARRNNMLFMEASAKTGTNVDNAFIDSAALILQKIEHGEINPTGQHNGIRVGSDFKNALTGKTYNVEDSKCKC